jgi:deoxyribonuclease V
MGINQLHDWQLSYSEAKKLQIELAPKISQQNEFQKINFIAGIDISGTSSHTGRAGIVVISYPKFELVENIKLTGVLNFPYIPGLLSFREIPLALSAFKKLQVPPDLILIDGHGISHPRQFGLASHLGLILNVPAIGCAKSRLCGTHKPVDMQAGNREDLIFNNMIVGVALRTKSNVKPVYVSIGHKIDLSSAINWVLQCCRGYRIPEPCRLAHLISKGIL